MSTRDGQNYAPNIPESKPVVEPGAFVFAASHFDHGHIYGQIEGLRKAGGTLAAIYEPDATRHKDVLENSPGCRVVDDFREILDDEHIRLVTAAAIPNLRCGIGMDVLASGKDYLTDKAPFTTLEQLALARQAVRETGHRYMCCFSERLLNEASYHAGEMVREGVVGDVLQVINMAPHNLAADTRPDWFFQKEAYGGILTDIGSHQFEQFLHFTGATGGNVSFARVRNFANPEHPGLEDFGEAVITTDTGASCYCRLDWFNPGGLRTWGDGRTFVLGTKGTLEIRKYVNVAQDTTGNRIFLVDGNNEQEIECEGKVGFPFFGELILDILNGTDRAMTQDHVFRAAELSMEAQRIADQGGHW